jgi:hypothetical protein
MGNHPLAQTPNVTGDIMQGSIEYSSKIRSGSRLMCRLKFINPKWHLTEAEKVSQLSEWIRARTTTIFKVKSIK